MATTIFLDVAIVGNYKKIPLKDKNMHKNKIQTN